MKKNNLDSKLNNHTDEFSIQLIITENCNLQCRYCFEHGKNPKYMDINVAKQILDKELNATRNFKRCTIDLCGGEPFLHFEFIKELTEYARANVKKWNKEILFFMTSNVTLLNDEIKEWLTNNKNWFIVGTSLDGIKKVHDYNRSNSYDDVVKHIDFLKKVYPNQFAKMTIGPDSIPYIYENFRHIEELGMPFTANVVYENVWGNDNEKKKLLKIFAEQLELLVEYYSKNKKIKVPSLLDLPIHRINMFIENSRWCGSGHEMKAYDTEGNVFPCHRYTYFCSKKPYNKENVSTNQPPNNNKCLNCEFVNACPYCAAYSWEVHNNSNIRTNHHCEFIKLQLLATSKLIYNKNKDLIEKLSTDKHIARADAISDILNNIIAANKIIQHINIDDILSEDYVGSDLKQSGK